MESTSKAPLKNVDNLVYVGVGLAIISSVFIGSSFIIKKVSLMRLTRTGCLRAGAGGFGYLKDWMWWSGLISMGVGELANFTAYTFAPASLVTPLGALSVLVSSILASRFLNESLNFLGKLGCVLCLIGSAIIVIHSPKEQEVGSINELMDRFRYSYFLNYVVTVVFICLSIVFYFGPKYGGRFVIIYISLCSLVGSLTVMACKGLGLAIKEVSLNEIRDNWWLVYVLLIVVITCVCVQMNYLNKALDIFNTTLVTPIYYVLFTTLVIIASSILFEEWRNIELKDILGSACGFFIVIVAIFLLQCFKSDPMKPLLKSAFHNYNSNTYLPR